MLRKYFSLASAASLAGAVAWVSATTACGGEDSTPVANGTSTSSGGNEAGASSSSSSGSDTSTTSSSSGGAGGNPVVGKDPATVPGKPVTYGKCAAFTKCADDIKGQWDLTGGCLPDTTFDPYKQYCAGITVHDVTIKVNGTVGIDATNVIRDSSIFVNAQIDIDKANCAALALAGTCANVGGLLKQGQGGAKFDEVECKDTPNACLCTAQTTVTEKTNDPYTDNGGTLKTTGAVERTFDHCVKGTTAMYQETTPKNATFNMFVQITKK